MASIEVASQNISNIVQTEARSELYRRQEGMVRTAIARLSIVATLVGGSTVALGASQDFLGVLPVAVAETETYPYSDKPCVALGDPQIGQASGTGYWCDGYQWGDPVKDRWGNIVGGNQNSPFGFGYRNCTDWAAFRAKQLTGVQVPYGSRMGNAGDWDNNAPTHKYTVDNTPEVGDIAVWDPTPSNSYGHVAIVESVNNNGSVNISEYNRNQDGNYGTRSSVIANHYVDLDGSNATPPAQPPAPPNLLVRHGNTVAGKTGLYDPWLTLTYSAQDVQAAGQRVVARDTNGYIVAKEGLTSTWMTESGPAEQYVLTPNLLAIRQGGAIMAKARLHDPWTTITASGATDLKAAGGRIAWRDIQGVVWGRDGVQGVSYAETSGAEEYDVTPNLLLVRQGTTLIGKEQLTDMWSTLTTAATNVEASAQRIVITDTGGNIQAKYGLGGVWFNEAGDAHEYVITPDLLLVRQGNTLIGKVALADQWTTITTGATKVKAVGNRIAITDTNGYVVVKDGLYGTWVAETSGASQFEVARGE